MAIAAQPPLGGIMGEVGGQSRPLRLGNAEIERFEAQHGLGIFAMLDQLVGLRDAPAPQARQVRDLVALALVGGGLPDRAADTIVSGLGPHENHRLRMLAHDALMVAFMPPPEPGAGGQTQKKATILDRQTRAARQRFLERPRKDQKRHHRRTDPGRGARDDAVRPGADLRWLERRPRAGRAGCPFGG